jgi:hypothetical protein
LTTAPQLAGPSAPVRVHHQDGLDLRIVVRVVAREQRNRAPVGEPEAGRGIGHPLAHDQRQEPGEDPDASAPRGGRLVAGLLGEAGAEDEVHRVIRSERIGQALDLRGIVLTIPVHLDGEVVPVVVGVAVARLHCAADAEVERHPQDRGPGVLGDRGGGVRGAVVDDEHVELRRVPVQRIDHATHASGLVVGRHDRETALVQIGESITCHLSTHQPSGQRRVSD